MILLDVQMPVMDGYETARLIRARERTRHVPIIFTTAHVHDNAAVLRAYALGAVDFLPKPIVPEVLCAKALVFVTLQERTEQLAAERMEREFENRRRDYEALSMRRERDREYAAKQELANANEALEESDRRKDSFIAILAHELRNPLAPLRTCIDIVKESPGTQLTPKLVDILDRQTTVLVRLVDDLLDVSRIKADKIELRPDEVDIVDVVEAAITTSRPQIDERGHALVFETSSAQVMVVADNIRLSQVICNLLNNAARYTPRGGRIEVAIADEGAVVCVTIRDNGDGIPAELQESIFNMFVQERVRSDGSGGLGLGLALSRRLVELHGGSIGVSSEGRGRGSTFAIHIPKVGSPLAVPVRKRTRDMVPLSREDAPRSIRTVVIDDNDDARELISDLLRLRGYEVITAADGPTGVRLIQEHRPELALVDLGLPALDGFGVIESLRRDCPDLKTRLVALTGYGHADAFERTKRAGFHAHLVKPASANAILDCIAKQLDEV